MDGNRSRRTLRRFFFFYLLFLSVYWCYRITDSPEIPPHTAEYIQRYENVAREVSRHTGVPPAIILAVGGLESGWGSSELARRGNNHFGIKADDEGYDLCCLPTREYYSRKASTVNACFRAYDHPRDSFLDFGKLLSEDVRYAPLFQHRHSDYRSWAQGLQNCGYATDPRYAEKLIRIVHQYRLYR